jgi:ribosome-associated heat shock protein Hsp15
MPRERAERPTSDAQPAARQRLDKWLWFARFARTRPAVQALIEAGHVRIEGRRVTAPGHGLKLGDVLTVAAPHGTVVLRVTDLGGRRGDSAAARQLYSRIDRDPSASADGCGETRS